MPGADRDGLTAGPADRLQAVGGAIVALDSGLGHMSEMNASIAQYYAAHYKNDGCAPAEHQLRLAYTTPVATLHRFGALGACEPHGQAACPTTELDLRLGRTL